MPISSKTVETFTKSVPWDKTVKKAVNAQKGQRLFPSKTAKNDEKLNFRVDKGSVIGDKHELILQANKNAKDKSVREAAAKDSHAIVAVLLVDPNNEEETQKAGSSMLSNFKAVKKD